MTAPAGRAGLEAPALPAEPTLFALSSGAPPAAVAIVRITGPRAAAALAALAGRMPAPRRATLRALRAGDGTLLDRALVLWFPGLATATGEDLAELHLHGSRAVVAAVLAALAEIPGLAPAPPGAFTRRAFANGRIDLSEAEGLGDLLAAESEGQRRQALRLAEGGLGRLLAGWRVRLLDAAAMIEAAIDHADEADVASPDPAPALSALRDELAAALRAPPAERLRDGIRVVLAGPVNAGKSSLFNALVGRDAAIVSPAAGTTRDLVEAPIVLDGMPLVLVDSAGLRTSQDLVEREGIDRARRAAADADILLWLGDPAQSPRRDAMTIAAKSDLPADHQRDGIAVSAVTGAGLHSLRQAIVQRTKELIGREDRLALNRRHRHLLGEALVELNHAQAAVDHVLSAEHIRAALAAFDHITGRTGVEEMLDAVFARFCIGK